MTMAAGLQLLRFRGALVRSSKTACRPAVLSRRRLATRTPPLHRDETSHGRSDEDTAKSSGRDGGGSSSSSSTTTTTTALPLPDSSPSSPAADGAPQTLRVGGSLRLDDLGPLVVNPDGSVGRVGNWAGMTPGEREATLRLLNRRNRQRLDALQAKAGAGAGTDGESK